MRLAIPAVLLLALGAGTAHAQTPPPDSTAAAAAVQTPPRRPGLGSWTTDRRDFRVGDIVTILVDEVTIASADKSNVDSQGRSTDAGAGFSPPTGDPTNVSFRTRLDNESATRGQARRRDVLTTELSARVVEVGDGVMKLEGSRTLKIDKAVQKVTLTGWARPQDITPRNFVDSWRLADAELLYESTGDLGKPKTGIITKILGILWP